MSLTGKDSIEKLQALLSEGEYYIPEEGDCDRETVIKHLHEELGVVAFRGVMRDWHPVSSEMFIDTVLDAELARASGKPLTPHERELLRADIYTFYESFAWWVPIGEEEQIKQAFDTERLNYPPLDAFHAVLSGEGLEPHTVMTFHHGTFNLTDIQHRNLANLLSCMFRSVGAEKARELSMVLFVPAREADSFRVLYGQSFLIVSTDYLGFSLDESLDSTVPEMTPRYVFERVGKEILGGVEDQPFSNLRLSSFNSYLHAVPVITNATIQDIAE